MGKSFPISSNNLKMKKLIGILLILVFLTSCVYYERKECVKMCLDFKMKQPCEDINTTWDKIVKYRVCEQDRKYDCKIDCRGGINVSNN